MTPALLRLVLLLLGLRAFAPSRDPTDDPFPRASAESVGMSDAALHELARVVQSYVDDDKIVGAELLVIKERRTVLDQAFGWRDREEQAAMTCDTIFNVRSMTKPLIGASIQILLDEGALALEDEAAKYLPGFDNDKSRHITIEQLLTHRSGLPLTILTKRLDEYETLEAQANAVGVAGPQFEPGSRFWYSDAGTDVLAAIVEVASGMDLAAFVQARLLDPLGMSDSFFLSKTTPHAQDRIASLYFGSAGKWARIWKGSEASFYPFPWGSQTLFSTARDYARWLALWLDGGRARGVEVLSEEAVQRTLTPRSSMSMLGSGQPFPTGFSGLTTHYGQLSVLHVPTLDPKAKPVVVGHSGSDGTIAWAWPARDLMILFFTQSRGGLTPIRLERDIERLLLAPSDPGNVAPVPEPIERYVGPYHLGFKPFEVFVQDGKLAFDHADSLAFPLEAPGRGDRWSLKGAEQFLGSSAYVQFVEDETGAVIGLKLAQDGRTTELNRGPAPAEPRLDAARLQAYVGTYRDHDSAESHQVVVRDGRLALWFADLPSPVLLFAPDEEGWRMVRANPAMSLRFHDGPDGRADSCIARVRGREVSWPRVELR
jgi:CubicO group peptidase (beta-lactamase class C family)